jgi:hypothetical protein
VRYTLCGQDARTTGVLSLISIIYNTGNCCRNCKNFLFFCLCDLRASA